MTDQGFREIQLGGKQLVFLFMASFVLAVAIFLLGVSVGRGVGPGVQSVVAGTDEPAPTAGPPAEIPPRTETTPDDLAYHSQLQGQTPPASTERSEPPPAVPPAPVDPPEPPPAPRSSPEPSSPPPASAAPARGSGGTASATGGWNVQVGAFGSKQNADRLVTQLNAKGHKAYSTFGPSAGGRSWYYVRVGPFGQRSEADQAVTRLRREGFQPSVTR